MLKLTRLNNKQVAINPDHIAVVDVSPDTTIQLISGDKIIVRESLDQLIAIYIDVRRKIHSYGEGICPFGRTDGELIPIARRRDDDEG